MPAMSSWPVFCDEVLCDLTSSDFVLTSVLGGLHRGPGGSTVRSVHSVVLRLQVLRRLLDARRFARCIVTQIHLHQRNRCSSLVP